MKIDILFPVYNRREFANEALKALTQNTDLDRARLCVHNDSLNEGPVAVMNRFLARDDGSAIFAKIDSDTIVPPGWLDAALAVMQENPELDLLGIEPPASRTPAPWGGRVAIPEFYGPFISATLQGPAYARCDMIGGIGLMRRSAFAGREPMIPHAQNGVGGFSDWQLKHPEVTKGWIVPPLNVFLLDRLPIEPWASLSKEYIQKGWQRPWTNYSLSDSALWEWWLKAPVTV